MYVPAVNLNYTNSVDVRTVTDSQSQKTADISTVLQIQTRDQTARTFHAPELLPYSDFQLQSAHFSHFPDHGSRVKMEDMSTVFQEFHGRFL